ncbi:hypothetical protein B0T45_21670 [Chromobacterium haemolyticum]|uniref:Phage tail assembly chaperone-like domain-containing protein n=2 Tax=Chromobacterium haemolyticum TaxID=394935 RepID=A0A1W0CCP9_9NEIS|nr:hypothetical protein B0T45_21670 [Chromobacterium haemolyticum]
MRAQRDERLRVTEWFVQRHRDEVEMSLPTTMNSDQFKQLQMYRQALRDVPEQKEFPTQIEWPAAPT